MRVAIRAAALNHLDIFVRNGIPNVPLPQIPGADGAGVVDAVGAGVEGLAPGDRVLIQPGLSCGACEFCRGGEQSLCVTFRILGEHAPGTFAENVVVPARNVFPIPEGIRSRRPRRSRSSTRPPGGWSSARAAVRPGETVLVHGVGGGVARRRDRDRAALRRARDRDDLGRGEGAAARARRAPSSSSTTAKEDVGQAVRRHTAKRGVDVVVDAVGEATWMTSLRAAAKGGRIVTCGATSGPNPKEEIRLIFWKQLSILGSTMANDREFRALYAAVASGKLGRAWTGAFRSREAAEAYALMEEGRQHGKIVLVPEGREEVAGRR